MSQWQHMLIVSYVNSIISQMKFHSSKEISQTIQQQKAHIIPSEILGKSWEIMYAFGTPIE